MNTVLTMKYPSTWHGDMWREAAPCGNGLLGASVYGGVKKEIILLNHAHLWRGGKTEELPDVSGKLPLIREHLEQNNPFDADKILSESFLAAGYHGENAIPLPLGDIVIESHSNEVFSHYRREIDMRTAEVSVRWDENSVAYRRRTFVSRADNLVYTEITCAQPLLDISVMLSAHDSETIGKYTFINKECRASGGHLYFAAFNDGAYYAGDFGAAGKVYTDGNASDNGTEIRIINAAKVLIVTRLFVNSNRNEEFAKPFAARYDYDEALSAHNAIHGKLFDRVRFEISHTHTSNEELLLQAFEDEAPDELIEKLYHYGRYLFICSTSDANTLPCHLIGLWNGSYNCFWAFYMYNVNFEMIYWQALTGNLPEFLRLALDYTEAFVDDFQENARKMFGCRGIYINSVNTPESGLSKCLANHILNWTAGAAWFSQHYWDYFKYTDDVEYLKRHAMPFMYEAALFYEDFLTTGADGYLQFSPSVSPENTARNIINAKGQRKEVETCVNATMDIAAAKELLTNLIEGNRLTGMYSDKIPVWRGMLEKLPPYRLNEAGAIKEWTHDFYLDNDNHRHHSHLYPVFPGREVGKSHPLYSGFEKAEDLRLTSGLSDQSSWSMVFMACIAARMGNGGRALFALDTLARTCLMNNFFTVHNDWRRMGAVYCADFRYAPFQIDGNIGIPAVINEMLLYSVDDEITLLPALPSKWKEGNICGLSAMGNVTCDIYWDDSRVKAVLFSEDVKTRKVRFDDTEKTVHIKGRAEIIFAI